MFGFASPIHPSFSSVALTDIIVEKGCVPRVVSLLDSPNDDVLYRATGVLHNVSCNNQMAAQAMDGSSALPRIIELLASKNELIQENASGTLMNLGCVSTKAIQIAQLGGVKYLVDLLAQTENDQIAYRVCGALFNISFGEPASATSIVSYNGVRALLGAMRRSAHLKVIEYALGTLAMVLSNAWSAAALEIVAGGGVELLMGRVLGEFRTSRIITEATNILTSLGDDVTIVVRNGFLPNLIRLLSLPPVEQLTPQLEAVFARVKETLRSAMEQGIAPESDAAAQELSGFESLVNSPRFHDLVLVFDNHRFYAHKVVLFGRSEYFRAMFERWLHNIPLSAERRPAVSGDPSEAFYELPLHFDGVSDDISPDTVVELLRFFYTGRCNFNENNVVPLLQLAGLYNETKLSAMCELELYAGATLENWLDILHISVQFSTKQLHRVMIAFAICNIELAELPPACLPLLTDAL